VRPSPCLAAAGQFENSGPSVCPLSCQREYSTRRSWGLRSPMPSGTSLHIGGDRRDDHPLNWMVTGPAPVNPSGRTGAQIPLRRSHPRGTGRARNHGRPGNGSGGTPEPACSPDCKLCLSGGSHGVSAPEPWRQVFRERMHVLESEAPSRSQEIAGQVPPPDTRPQSGSIDCTGSAHLTIAR
jgi:hypothetical protein